MTTVADRATGEVITDPLTATPDLNLANLCSGAAEDLFQEVLKKVLENVFDPNTDASKERKIVLTITLKPDADRSTLDAEVNADVKLAPVNGAHGKVFAGLRYGKPVATAFNLEQLMLFPNAPGGPRIDKPNAAGAAPAKADETPPAAAVAQ